MSRNGKIRLSRVSPGRRRAGAGIGSLLLLGAVLGLLARTGREPASPPPPPTALRGYLGADADEPPYAPDRLLVRLDDDAAATARETAATDKSGPATTRTGVLAVDALARAAGVVAVSRPHAGVADAAKSAGPGAVSRSAAAAAELERWVMFRFAGSPDLPGLAADFAVLPGVQAVSLDWRVWPADVPADPAFAANWGHENTAQLPAYTGGDGTLRIGAGVGTPGFDADVPEAWLLAQGYGSADVLVAIIDSGVDLDHPDLDLVPGYDFGDDDDDPDDDSAIPGHGTSCAGVAAALGNGIGSVGVAPGCRIMPLKAATGGGVMYLSAIQKAIRYAADNGADVVSMSFGAPLDGDPAMEDALRYAYEAGVVLVAAAGNANADRLLYPASSPYVIAVGAASPGGDRKRSASNPGLLDKGVFADPNGCTCDGEVWWGSNYGSAQRDAAGAVDLLGPTILPTCDISGPGGYRDGDLEPWFNGTSCATPYVAGVAALLRSAVPGLKPALVREALVGSARDVVSVESAVGWDRYAGYGLVNARAAILAATAAGPVAAFTASPTGGRGPLRVDFSDASSGGPTSWAWDFGDGATSAERHPSHVYATAGTYDVVLTVANADGADTLRRAALVTVTGAAGALAQNEPNPFNPVTRIAFELARSGPARLTVYNVRGEQVARLADGDLAAGRHVATWDATGQPSGLYFYRLQAPGVDETRKMTLLK